MLARIRSGAIMGVEAYPIEVEVDLSKGMMMFTTVGLPSNAVCESKTRVKSALINSGFNFPNKRVVVNLAPAHIKKEGTAFDLPIALGILQADEKFKTSILKDFLVLGELSLNGEIRSVRGSLALALWAKKNGVKGILIPKANAFEVAMVSDLTIWVADHLKEVVDVIQSRIPMTIACISQSDIQVGQEWSLQHKIQVDYLRFDLADYYLDHQYTNDLSEVQGQDRAKRALEIAAAGAHNLILMGPPGSGKSMLAKRLSSILPPLTFPESITCAMIQQAFDQVQDYKLSNRRPFRAPHHSISQASLTGGGSQCKPGEITLAHHGVLFLDELPEFRRNVLESLRQPLEDHHVTVSRAMLTVNYPASFMLIAALNPCPCGYATDPNKMCQCHPKVIANYFNRISGPLLDRIDLQVTVDAVDPRDLRNPQLGESSHTVSQRVLQARQYQYERLQEERCNAYLSSQEIRKYCELSSDADTLFIKAIEHMGFSARAHDRILKVARTIADLEQVSTIRKDHIAEAVQYRQFDRLRMQQKGKISC